MWRSRTWPRSRASTSRSPTELQDRARNALERRDREYEERYHQLGVEDDLTTLDGLTPGMLVRLGENGIKTLDDFAGLAGDELVEMLAALGMSGAKLETRRRQRADHGGAGSRRDWFEAGRSGRPAEKEIAKGLGRRRHSPASSAGTAGAEDEAPGPQRRCIVIGEVRDRDALIRFVVGRRTARRAGYRGAAAGTGFVVDAAPGYSGAGGGEAGLRAGGAAPGHRAAGTLPTASKLCWRDAVVIRLVWRDGPGLPSPGSTGSATRCGVARRRFCCSRSMAPKPAAASWARSARACRRRRRVDGGRTRRGIRPRAGRARGGGGGTLCRRLLLDLSRLAGLRTGAALDQAMDFAPAGPAPEDGGTESA